jgi:hypothetical protein
MDSVLRSEARLVAAVRGLDVWLEAPEHDRSGWERVRLAVDEAVYVALRLTLAERAPLVA